MSIPRFCNDQVITAVNGQFPGPTIRVREGDTHVVHVLNKTPYDITCIGNCSILITITKS